MPDKPTLDPSDIASQAAAIAQHLQRSGVQWLPKANAAAVEKLSERFAVGADENADENAALPAPTASSPTPIAEPAESNPQVVKEPTQPKPAQAAVPISPIDQAYPGVG